MGASACQIQEAIPDIPALRSRPHVKAPGGGSQVHSGSNLIQPQTKTPSIGNEKYGDRPTINENIGDMTILPVGQGRHHVAQTIASQTRVLSQAGRYGRPQPTHFGARWAAGLSGGAGKWELVLGTFLSLIRLALPFSIPRIVLRARL